MKEVVYDLYSNDNIRQAPKIIIFEFFEIDCSIFHGGIFGEFWEKTYGPFRPQVKSNTGHLNNPRAFSKKSDLF